jgi:pyruvate formate lyase activating enzyme
MLKGRVAASFWQPAGERVACGLCPHACRLAAGQTGRCRVRRNDADCLYAVSYGEVSALALDPIEKKPLYRFKPGSRILSAGSWGCNFSCRFCQNWLISQQKPAVRRYSPHELVKLAREAAPDGNIGLAYTYSEPLIWYEFIRDCALLIKEAGLDNILVSNGYINLQPLRELAPLLAAANIDLKAFSPVFYQDVCGGSLPPVLDSIKLLAGYCHVEVTALILPGYNDGAEEMGRLAAWLAGIDDAIPLHINRYFPQYRFSLPPTPRETLLALKAVAGEYLAYVYVGNV